VRGSATAPTLSPVALEDLARLSRSPPASTRQRRAPSAARQLERCSKLAEDWTGVGPLVVPERLNHHMVRTGVQMSEDGPDRFVDRAHAAAPELGHDPRCSDTRQRSVRSSRDTPDHDA
jgi:hypothetical protein